MTSAFPAFAINSYNATPAPERTEVGALIAQWDDDANPATPDRLAAPTSPPPPTGTGWEGPTGLGTPNGTGAF